MQAQLIAAFMLLTRLPVSRLKPVVLADDFAASIWAFPLVGLIVGLIAAAVYGTAYWLGMPPLLATGWMLAATLLVTGALHEDGLADTADGFGGGGTPARKMDIMRDSRIGSYGALAVIVATLVRVGAVVAIARPSVVAAALVVGAMLGRAALIVLVSVLDPARADGLGGSMTRPKARVAAIGLGPALVAPLVLLPFGAGVAAIGAAVVAAFAMSAFSRRQIGGYTGDVLGAAEIVVECSVLSAVACFAVS